MPFAKRGDDYSYQLTRAPLDQVKLQFSLHTPYRVFRCRPNLSLEDATTFDLLMQLRSMGFQDLEISDKAARKAAKNTPFTPGRACPSPTKSSKSQRRREGTGSVWCSLAQCSVV